MFEKNGAISRLIIIGDRVLVRPLSAQEKTAGGLFLPPGVLEKEKVQSGYILKVGPGYPIPMPADSSYEPWKDQSEQIKYVPLQARVGDLAIFLQKGATEVIYQEERYFIVSQDAILMLERDEEISE